MASRPNIQQWMPLLREYGSLERMRLSQGVTPLEYQRWLDLKGKIGERFARSRADGLAAIGGAEGATRPTRLRVAYKSRAALRAAIVENIVPAGFFVSTPFAAEVGTAFRVCLTLEHEGETGEVPAVVAESMCDSAVTLSTMSMGMSLKIQRPNRSQAEAISRLFDGAFDTALGLDR